MLTYQDIPELVGKLLLKLNITDLEHSDFMYDYLVRCCTFLNTENEVNYFIPKHIVNIMYPAFSGIPTYQNSIEYHWLISNREKFFELAYLYQGLELL